MNLKIIFLLAAFIAVNQLAAGQSYIPDQNNSKIKVEPVVKMGAYAFSLADVQLLDSPFKTAMEADSKYLLSLSPDRLLSQFRSHAGLQPKDKIYGGWENLGLAGHTLGHYLSACAMQYAVSRDTAFLNRVNYVVNELEECQRARGTGYVGAIPKEDSVFNAVASGNIRSRGFDLNGAWSPWYTVHKVMSGLVDAYLYCDNEKALKISLGIADWSQRILQNLNDDQVQKMLVCEYGGMNDVLVNLYALTADKKYLDLSYKFHDKRVLDSLAMGFDVLPGKHSNTQIPKVIGTARRYEVTGVKKDLDISDFFWKTVVGHHTYAPGGNSNYEYLSKADALSGKLTDNTMETCNTYNMLKLTRHLFALNPSVHYMDFYERALYNHILASQNHQDAMMCYFVPLRMGTKKQFSDPASTFTCCEGSGIENHVKYGESIYFRSAEGGLYVNLFIPSKLTWKEKELAVTLKSNLPIDKTVSLTIETKKSMSIPIHLRKPYWVERATLKVNGKVVKSTLANNGYMTISRAWKNGDVIQVDLPSSLRAEPTPDNPSRQAFFFGPVLLAGNLGEKEPDPMNGTPVFVTGERDPKKWIVQDKTDLSTFYASHGSPVDVKFQPFYSIRKDYYSVYWDVFTPTAWDAEKEKYEQKKKAEYEMEQSTTDVLRVGEMQPERDHNLTGDKTEAGESHTRKFRTAKEGGSFSFTMKVASGYSLLLVVTYWGMENRDRIFDIFVDGAKIATEDLNKYKRVGSMTSPIAFLQSLPRGRATLPLSCRRRRRTRRGLCTAYVL